MKIIDANTKEPLFSFENEFVVWALSFNPEKKICAIGVGEDETSKILIINIEDKKIIFSKEQPSEVYSVFFNANNILTYTLANRTFNTINIKEDTIVSSFSLESVIEKTRDEFLFAFACNHNAHKFVFGLSNGDIYITDSLSKRLITSFYNPSEVYSLSLDASGQKLAIGLKNGKFLLLQEYVNFSPNQLFLRKILYLWLQVQKPNRNVTNYQRLLKSISSQFHLNNEDLNQIWNTFSPSLQKDLWGNIRILIKKYGKKVIVA
jgi:WD40 repeat protein